MPSLFNVLDLQRWIAEHAPSLKPPVGNRELYPGGDFIVMVVAGPNDRKDYHYNETPEFFYQIQGDISLKLVNEGKHERVEIRQGEIYLLPAKVSHSPQRPAGTIGLVIEQKRGPSHRDGFQWYCERCGHLLHEVYLGLEDIVTQLPIIFAEFKADKAKHCCSACGFENDF